VADNTTQVSFSDDFTSKKEAFLFVGTLYKQKGIDTLLESYKKLNLIDEANTPELNIIGEGPERSYIEEWIKSNNLSNKIFLHGAIYDIEILKQFYNKSLACISPNQAGLSVLTSMGYATVFVTEKNAITGGEIFSITNEVNGIIYEGQEKLTDTLLWIINNKDRVIKMGANAREFYCQNRRPDQMAGSLIKAVEYALELKGNA
jgi:glycosyltransferase involved in cell wall biosynthesis